MYITDQLLPVYNIHKWGRAGWNFILACAFVYPAKPTPEDREKIFDFLRAISHVRPCGICRHHFGQGLDNMPQEQALSSPLKLVKWLHGVQNDIRIRQGKRPTPLDEFLNECTRGYTGYRILACTWKQLALLLFVILLLLIGYVIYAFRR